LKGETPGKRYPVRCIREGGEGQGHLGKDRGESPMRGGTGGRDRALYREVERKKKKVRFRVWGGGGH